MLPFAAALLLAIRGGRGRRGREEEKEEGEGRSAATGRRGLARPVSSPGDATLHRRVPLFSDRQLTYPSCLSLQLSAPPRPPSRLPGNFAARAAPAPPSPLVLAGVAPSRLPNRQGSIQSNPSGASPSPSPIIASQPTFPLRPPPNGIVSSPSVTPGDLAKNIVLRGVQLVGKYRARADVRDVPAFTRGFVSEAAEKEYLEQQAAKLKELNESIKGDVTYVCENVLKLVTAATPNSLQQFESAVAKLPRLEQALESLPHFERALGEAASAGASGTEVAAGLARMQEEIGRALEEVESMKDEVGTTKQDLQTAISATRDWYGNQTKSLSDQTSSLSDRIAAESLARAQLGNHAQESIAQLEEQVCLQHVAHESLQQALGEERAVASVRSLASRARTLSSG